jgi:amino acid adenylation domain-containing protein
MRQIPARETTTLSPYQQRIWYLQELTQQAGLLHVSKAFRLVGHVEHVALGQALDIVVNRHEILRTGFHFEGDAIRCAEVKHVDCPLEITALSGGTASVDDELVAELQRGARTHIDLTVPPLLRCRLLQLTDRVQIFSVTAHLLVWDEASFGFFMEELLQAYAAIAAGEKAPESAAASQYSSAFAQQQRNVNGREFAVRLEHWVRALADAPAVTTIYSARSRSLMPSYRARTVRRAFAPATVAAVASAEEMMQAHRSMILLAAYVVLLYRYTGQTDLVLGIKVDGRRSLADRRILGPLEEVLPLRIGIAAEDLFEAVVRRVQAAMDVLLANQDVPFKSIVDVCEVDKTPNRAPIYQTMFVFDEGGNCPETVGGLQLGQVDVPEDFGLLDLSLKVTAANDAMSVLLKFSTDVMAYETIEMLGEHFELLLRSVVSNLLSPISEARLLSDVETERLLFDWNATKREWTDTEQTAAQLILRHRDSQKTAVVDRSGSICFADLVRRAAQYSNVLETDGVAPGDVVGICMDRSIDLVVAMLACLMARAAYLPLDAALPNRRLAAMVEGAGAKVVICTENNRARLDGLGARLVATDSDEWRKRVDAGDQQASLVDAKGSDLAYVIFTSGSTGTPKGVRVLNSGVVNLIHALTESVGPGESDCVLAHTTLSFDIHVLETLVALAAHATIYMASSQEAEDARVFVGVVERQNVTFLQCTPARWKQLETSGWHGKTNLRALVGGEAVSGDVARFLGSHAGSAWNMYGPTETTVWSTCAPLDAGDEKPAIGRPIANTRVYVLDERRRLVPTGVPGELYIAGAGVAGGYLADAELTDSRFLDLTLSTELSERVYKTGDRVRYDFDGRLHFIERVDTQIKLRGFRIELAEIESSINRLDSVEACAVVVSGMQDDHRLVAFVVPKPRHDLSAMAVRKALRDVLPSHMLPQHYHLVPSLPTTRNGKLDRIRLSEIGTAGVTSSDNRTRPATATETRMAEIWRDLIGIEHVFAEDNFLDVGGHSLLSVTFIARWKRDTGVALSPRDVVLNDLASIAKLSDNASSRLDHDR